MDALLASLVSVDLTNRNSNLALIGCVSEYLNTREISYRTGTDSVVCYQTADIATIVRGTGPIGQAHQPDERIAQELTDAGDAFVRRLVDRVPV
jgi:hypothetical protein